MAVELVQHYENGFLPSAGGWMDQDELHVFLIDLAISRKRVREKINQETEERNRAHQRGRGRRR